MACNATGSAQVAKPLDNSVKPIRAWAAGLGILAVDPHLDRVGEVGADLHEAGAELFIDGACPNFRVTVLCGLTIGHRRGYGRGRRFPASSGPASSSAVRAGHREACRGPAGGPPCDRQELRRSWLSSCNM